MKRPHYTERENRIHWWTMGVVVCLAFWALNTEEIPETTQVTLGIVLLLAFFAGDDLTHLLIGVITLSLLWMRFFG